MQTLILALTTICLTAPPPASHLQEARAARVAPFVDDQTIAVVRIDATRIDVPKLKELIGALSGGYDERGSHTAALLAWVPTFVNAGGKELYLISSLEDMAQRPFFGIAPLSNGADPQRLIEALGTLPGLGNQERQQLGTAVFVGSKPTLERLKTAKPAARKEIAAALEAAGDAAVQVLFVPTADSRRVVEELMPTLPPELGGGSVKVLTHGFLWAAVGLDGPPATSIRVVVQSENPEKAKELADFSKSNLARLAKLPMAEKIAPGISAILSELTPTVAGERVTLSLDEKNFTTLLKPAARVVHDTAYRSTSMNNLKQIALALHNYHDVHKAFPAVANFDAQGKPLLSWRVHILPYLGEEKLYKEFHLDEPWDSDHNKKLVTRIPNVFAVPGLSDSDKGLTTYLAPVAANAMWTGTATRVKINEVTDGTSNTIFVIDAADKLAAPWTKPADYTYDPKDPSAGLAYRYGSVVLALFADGSVQTLPKTISAQKMLALFTRNGGEVIGNLQD
jgi:Protein of unknown function (DUF1559)